MNAGRRNFLKHFARGGFVAGWVLIAARLGSREGSSCPSTCAGCRLYRNCRKPQRLEVSYAQD